MRGSLARVGLLATSNMPISEVRATVGRFVSIRSASSIIVAMITEVSCENLPSADASYIAVASVDLLGEILNAAEKPKFQRGVTHYPTIGDAVDLISSEELRTIYAPSGSDQINVGTLQQDRSVIAYVDVEEMLSKHFAILGSTGVGKSTGVSLLLNEILKARPNLRLFLLDVHNEYGRCFGDKALVLNPRNLKLPFWLFNFEEIVDVLFAGRPGVPEELDILAEVIPLAKGIYTQYQNSDRIGLKRIDPKQVGYTLDTPVPYRLQDLISLIDERMGKLENRSSRIIYHKLISRIDAVKNDPDLQFLPIMGPNTLYLGMTNTFAPFDNVRFDNSGSSHSSVNLSGDLNAGAVVVRYGSESEAHLHLPPATLDSRVTELLQEQWAAANLEWKRQAWQFQRVLGSLGIDRDGRAP